MTRTCITIPELPLTEVFPSVESLTIPFQSLYSIPSRIRESMPPFPTLPDTMTTTSPGFQFPEEFFPSLESVNWGEAVQSSQLFVILDLLIGSLTQFIAAIPIPDIPAIQASLADLLAFDPQPLLDMVRVPDFDWSLIPNLPELWPTVSTDGNSSLKQLQYAVIAYLEDITDVVLQLLDSFLAYLDSLELPYPSLPVFPTIPSLGEIEMALREQLPPYEFAGFPPLTIPEFHLPDSDNSDFKFEFDVKVIFQELNSYVIKSVTEYIQSLPLVGELLAILPTIEDMIGLIEFGEVCWDE